MTPTLRVCALYPELMNIYADRGNIAVLRARCEWRGLGFELAASSLGEGVDPDAHDLFYMGGGQDRDQALCAQDLVETKRDALPDDLEHLGASMRFRTLPRRHVPPTGDYVGSVVVVLERLP